MIKFLLIIAILISSSSIFSQDLNSINAELNTLNNKKRDIQENIKKYQNELRDINNQISELENKKANLSSSNNSETISAKVNSLEGILREKPTSLSNEIARIKEGESITVYREHVGLYLKVSYMGKTGYLSYSSISNNTEVDKILTSDENQTTNNSTTTINSVDLNDPKYKRLEKLYGKEKAMKIMNGELWKGMSYGQVIEALGQPTNKEKVNTLDGVQETWVYPNKKAIFLNGELNKWE